MKKGIIGCLLMLLVSMGSHAQETLNLKIGTYNIRVDNPHDDQTGNGWLQRLPYVASLIHWESPDVFGAQEVRHNQLEGMLSQLPGYTYFGVGRDDGKQAGEFEPVFYKKDKFNLLGGGNFWLSPTPDKPSMGWDAAYMRICSWAKLQDKKTKKIFWFFNLHMDNIGVVARRESARLVLKKMKEIAGNGTAFLVGDFNVDQHNEILGILNDSNYLKDSYELAKRKMVWNGSFNNFEPTEWSDNRIDHVFVTKGVAVSDYAVLTDTYRVPMPANDPRIRNFDATKGDINPNFEIKLPSDHYPIFERVEIPLR